jgi:glycosyltransferase involved in cell wall biosynthesis
VKVALIVPGGVDRSGEQRVIPALLALIERLARRHEVHVYALSQEARPGEWRLAGAWVHNIGANARVSRTIGAIRREHRRAAFDLVHAIWSGPGGLLGVSCARLLGIPNIVHLAGGELVAYPHIGYGGQLRLRWRLLEAIILRASTRVTAPSACMIEAAAKFGVQARRIPLGVDLAKWPAREPRPRASGEATRLLHIASLNRVKDQRTLLSALRLLRDSGRRFTADLVGEDTLGGATQRLASDLQLDDVVQFRGFLTQRELRPLAELAHIHVLSSIHEAGPLAMLECAALGIPTVGTEVGHVAEWAPVAALAVSVGDAAALADGIARLIDDEPGRLNTGRAAQAAARAEDADHTAAQFENLYDEITRERRPR